LNTPRRVLERAYGRPLGPVTRGATQDATRRAAHVARHSRLAPEKPRGDVFNIDMHAAVLSDVRSQLDRRDLSLVHWTLSGHSFLFGRGQDPVAIVNDRTWKAFSPRMADNFRRSYGSYLQSFDGFVAAYPPCFSLLYEGLGRPTLVVAATRYEYPLTHFRPHWDWLDDRLRAGVADGWLTLTANNRADADYLERYTGLRAAHIPSGCSYTGLTYTGTKRPAAIYTGRDPFAAAITAKLRHESIVPHASLGRIFSWADLYDQRAVVFVPYNVSIMALFEMYTACVPLYVPDRAFLKELMQRYPEDVLSSLSFCQVTRKPPARHGNGLDLNDVTDEAVVDWYLERADFYDTEWMPHIRLFESWEHLDHLLHTDDLPAISAAMEAARPGRLHRIDARWDELAWFDAVARRQLG
jgi:hypothetical protein